MTLQERKTLVEAAVERKGGNIRALAQDVAKQAGQAEKMETWRRRLYSVKAGGTVEAKNAVPIAKVLKIDAAVITKAATQESRKDHQRSVEADLDALLRSGAALLALLISQSEQIRELGGKVPEALLQAEELEPLRKLVEAQAASGEGP